MWGEEKAHKGRNAGNIIVGKYHWVSFLDYCNSNASKFSTNDMSSHITPHRDENPMHVCQNPGLTLSNHWVYLANSKTHTMRVWLVTGQSKQELVWKRADPILSLYCWKHILLYQQSYTPVKPRTASGKSVTTRLGPSQGPPVSAWPFCCLPVQTQASFSQGDCPCIRLHTGTVPSTTHFSFLTGTSRHLKQYKKQSHEEMTTVMMQHNAPYTNFPRLCLSIFY